MFASLPPMVIALVAMTFVLAWQSIGVALLGPVLRRAGIARGWSLVLAWYLWLPLGGGVALGLAFAEQARPLQLRALMGLAALGAATSVWRRRQWFTHWRRARGPDGKAPGRSFVWAAMGVGALKMVEALFAAHPQRLHDQLNNHLVVARQVLAMGHPFAKSLDWSILSAGPTAYAFLWPRALIGGDFFEIAAAQAWIYVASVGTVAGAAWLAARKVGGPAWRWAALALVAAVPALVPDAELMILAKPAAMLFAGTALVLLAMTERLGRQLAVAFAMLLTACHATYAHAALALVAVLYLAWREDHRPVKVPGPVLLIAVGVAGIAVLRSFVMTGTPLFPADLRFLPSTFSDAVTRDFWHRVAFGSGEAVPWRWLGALRVPARSPGLLAWVLPAAAAGLVGGLAGVGVAKTKPGEPPTAAELTAPAWAGTSRFVVVFALLWPLFYDSRIYTRFVTPYVAALLVLAFLACLRAPAKLGIAVAALGMCLAVACSSAGELARKLWRWNQTTLAAEFAEQMPRYSTANLVNAVAGPDDLIIADDPAKYFFDARVLDSGLSPAQRAIIADLAAAPQRAAAAHHIQAVVIAAGEPAAPGPAAPWELPARRIFASLAPYGTIKQVGPDLVLASRCHFKELPCAEEQPLRNVSYAR